MCMWADNICLWLCLLFWVNWNQKSGFIPCERLFEISVQTPPFLSHVMVSVLFKNTEQRPTLETDGGSRKVEKQWLIPGQTNPTGSCLIFVPSRVVNMLCILVSVGVSPLYMKGQMRVETQDDLGVFPRLLSSSVFFEMGPLPNLELPSLVRLAGYQASGIHLSLHLPAPAL